MGNARSARSTGGKPALNVSDEAIISALMQNSTTKAAADALGVRPQRLYDRMRTPTFKAAYTQAKADIIRTAVSALNGKLAIAIETISGIMTDTNTNAAVRLQAAQTVLSYACKFAERVSQTEEKADNAAPYRLQDYFFTESEAV